ncbi:hypothetical protein JL721_3419 [Aureococcus anophagefferens]|nr:hypothetical protein JL721_3419 [Aureococcus anophagefferens]
MALFALVAVPRREAALDRNRFAAAAPIFVALLVFATTGKLELAALLPWTHRAAEDILLLKRRADGGLGRRFGPFPDAALLRAAAASTGFDALLQLALKAAALVANRSDGVAALNAATNFCVVVGVFVAGLLGGSAAAPADSVAPDDERLVLAAVPAVPLETDVTKTVIDFDEEERKMGGGDGDGAIALGADGRRPASPGVFGCGAVDLACAAACAYPDDDAEEAKAAGGTSVFLRNDGSQVTINNPGGINLSDLTIQEDESGNVNVFLGAGADSAAELTLPSKL